MGVERKLRDRIARLAEEAERLAGPGSAIVLRGHFTGECLALGAAAQHALSLACPHAEATYPIALNDILYAGLDADEEVRRIGALLRRVVQDIDDGLLTSITNQARAETLDDLLDQAEEYLARKQLHGSAIITTAVYEDTLRRVCRANGITDKNVKTDDLITALTKAGTISGVVAKRCRAAAGTRNSALHAQWDEISLDDVRSVLTLTRELLIAHLS